jgi:hypothetical protein
MAIPQIRWQHTFYADGRHVTHVEINNAGGEGLRGAELSSDEPVAWFGHGLSAILAAETPGETVLRFDYLRAPSGPEAALLEQNYLAPAYVVAVLADRWPDDGQPRTNHFNPATGCYELASRTGQCRLQLIPPPEGLLRPTFRISGPWEGPVCANCSGIPVQNVVSLSDGSVLFTLDRRITTPAVVEVSGVAPSADRR